MHHVDSELFWFFFFPSFLQWCWCFRILNSVNENVKLDFKQFLGMVLLCWAKVGLYCTGCLMNLCQYIKILFLRPYPVRSVIWTWVWLSTVTEIWLFEMYLVIEVTCYLFILFFCKCVVWYHYWPAEWPRHLPAMSYRWHLHCICKMICCQS